MSKLNRRRFLQVATAAGLTPAIPALPAAATAAAPASLSTSQMLWSSLYASAGNAKDIAGYARAMGVSNHGAVRILSKLIETNAMAVRETIHLKTLLHPVATTPSAPISASAPPRKTIKVDLNKLLREDEVERDLLEEETPPEDSPNTTLPET